LTASISWVKAMATTLPGRVSDRATPGGSSRRPPGKVSVLIAPFF